MYLKVPSLVEGPPAEMFQNLFYDYFDFDYKFHDIFLLQIAFQNRKGGFSFWGN